ncbi:MAG: C39 family peptidase [Gemmatimonadetes bacterium]|nr:C39 family peptidase [Gemmatimonadota bacterium]
MAADTELIVDILPQPDDSTCGPTCLHAVYGYHGDPLPLDQVVREVTPLVAGGTLGVYLGVHALRRGYAATIYTYNLDIFDPSWFDEDAARLPGHLSAQMEVKSSERLRVATRAYLDFLHLGGRIRFEELRPELIRRHLTDGEPILTGLSATYLYGCAREIDRDGRLVSDSVRGEPVGHFVVVHGYDAATDSALVADPLHENRFGSHNYRVGVVRLLGAIMLGVLTYDGNLLVVRPREDGT